MRMLYFLLQKEFIQIARDKTILILLVLITIILLFILPRSAKMNLGQVPLSVIDHDKTPTSSAFIQKLTGTDCFVVEAYSDTYAEALAYLERNEAEGILEIPRGFEEKLESGGRVPLFVEIDAVNGVLAGLSSYYFTQILQQYLWEYIAGMGLQSGFSLESQEELMAKAAAESAPPSRTGFELLAAKNGKERQTAQEQAWTTSHPEVDVPAVEKPGTPAMRMVELETDMRYNPDGESKKYQIGAIVAVLVCLVGTVLSALNIVNEKESGTIEQMNVSPVRKSMFILAKVIPAWVVGMIILTLALIVSWLMYGVVPEGSYLSIYVVSFLFLMAMVGFGVLLSTTCRNQQQVMLLCFFFLLIICLLCGMWSPIGSMPIWARFIADINPLRYYVEALRLFFAYGGTLRDASYHMGMLCIFIVVFNTWAIWNFRKVR